jgi:hypothetical protein
MQLPNAIGWEGIVEQFVPVHFIRIYFPETILMQGSVNVPKI